MKSMIFAHYVTFSVQILCFVSKYCVLGGISRELLFKKVYASVVFNHKLLYLNSRYSQISYNFNNV
jgi:hypothetical protein